MNKQDAADFLGVSVRAVERYASAGRLPSRYVRGKTGQVLDFEQSDVDAFKIELETPVEKGTTSRDTTALATLDGPNPAALVQLAHMVSMMNGDKARQDAATVPVEARLFLTVTEAAQYAGVGKSAIEAAIKAGQINAHSGLGRGRRIKRADVEKWSDTL
jgi:excisionase family DNA binding protein